MAFLHQTVPERILARRLHGQLGHEHIGEPRSLSGAG
jgi:hypothetical protein